MSNANPYTAPNPAFTAAEAAIVNGNPFAVDQAKLSELRSREPLWWSIFRKALHAAAAKCGSDVSGLTFGVCDTDRTWGDRCGLVFWGASPEVNEKAARYFERWASKHLRAMGVVGGYDRQESISYFGPLRFIAYDNKASGWYRTSDRGVSDTKVGDGGEAMIGWHKASDPNAKPGEREWTAARCVGVRDGFATSYIYYPCAE